jgi:hypothetical protein
MSSLTSASPLPSLVASPVLSTERTSPVLQVLGVRQVNEARSSLLDALLEAVEPGNVLSGTVTSSQLDGTFTLTTKSGFQVTLHHPPEQPLTPGSTVTLRVITNGPTPQAALLQVNGRPVTERAPTVPQGPTPNFQPPAAGPAPPPASTASYSAALVASLGLAEEALLAEAGPGPSGLTITAAGAPVTPEAIGPTIVATLIRAAPTRPGLPPITIGTRYLVTVQAVEGGSEPTIPSPAASPPFTPRPSTVATAGAEPAPEEPPVGQPTIVGAVRPIPTPLPLSTPVEPAPEPVLAAAPIDQPAPPAQPEPTAEVPVSQPEPLSAAPPAASTSASPPATVPASTSPVASLPASTSSPAASPVDDLADFQPQVSQLVGRLVDPRADGESLVETAVGTLALPIERIGVPGAAIRLLVSAVAPPLAPPTAVHSASLRPAVPPPLGPLVETVTTALAGQPALSAEVQSVLAIQPGPQLASLLLAFLTGAGTTRRPGRGPEPSLRNALICLDRKDLAARLDAALDEIGRVEPQRGPDGWTVTTLPFLGALSTAPMRLYRRAHQSQDEADADEHNPGERFVVEVELERLGALQFDGLVRERRFDLALRTGRPLDPELRGEIEAVYRDTLLVSGWSGEIAFARTTRMPLVPTSLGRAHLDLGA